LLTPAVVTSGLLDQLFERIGVQGVTPLAPSQDVWLALICLVVCFFYIVSINRYWVVDEGRRASIAVGAESGTADAFPDVRNVAIGSALVLVVLFPLLLDTISRLGCVKSQALCVAESGELALGQWFLYAFEKYLRTLVLFDVPDAYRIADLSGVDVSGWATGHLRMMISMTFDVVLVTGLFQWWRIHQTSSQAVNALAWESNFASRVGRRILRKLAHRLEQEKSDEPTKEVSPVLTNAATALSKIGGVEALLCLVAVTKATKSATVLCLTFKATAEVLKGLAPVQTLWERSVIDEAKAMLREYRDNDLRKTVKEAAEIALNTVP
jgi:hypothetical protein